MTIHMFNLLFSKPVKLEYVEWTEDMSKQWNQIVNVSKTEELQIRTLSYSIEREDKRKLIGKNGFQSKKS